MDNPSAPRDSARLLTLRIVLLAAVSVVVFGAITLPSSLRAATDSLQPGEVSPRDFTAPRTQTYESAVLTEQRRQAAAESVLPVYSPPDPAIARQQVDALRAALNFITRTRDDTTVPYAQRQTALASIPGLSLSAESINRILTIDSARWGTLREESVTVLQRTLRGVIRESDVETVRRGVPSLVNFSLSETDVNLVAELIQPFIIANSLYSPELTESARQSARDAVEPVQRTVQQGETLVRAGEVLNEVQAEALAQLGLIQPGLTGYDFLNAGAVVAVGAGFIALYFYRRKRLGLLYDPRSLTVVAFIFILFLIGARFAIPGNVLLPYLYPLPAVGMMVAALFGLEAGMAMSLTVCLYSAYGFSSDLLPYYLLPSMLGVLALDKARRFTSYLVAGAVVAGACVAMLIAFRSPLTELDWFGNLQLLGAALGNGFLSLALALLGQNLFARWLGLATPLHLLEISRPDFPLLQFFLRNAPGTYQHSLQVANLAEQAAESIGADPLLTRVGALFHDVGKASNAAFFIENQAPGQMNTHQDMQPEEAAAIIIRHVTDGVALARKHRLPRRLTDFMLEHHGTMLTRYQYNLALQNAAGDESKLDKEKFRYPGPCPRSRETAILMLADGAEARTRAEAPQTEEEMRAVVRRVVDYVQREGQLDATMLTLRDLNRIVDSFVATLRGTYHPRIQYPAAEVPASESKP
jgi:putative nucleotidyltransferase with HDIG domain